MITALYLSETESIDISLLSANRTRYTKMSALKSLIRFPPDALCNSSSTVERDLAKVEVEGSNPFYCSIL